MTDALLEFLHFLRGIGGLAVGAWLVLLIKHVVRAYVDRAN